MSDRSIYLLMRGGPGFSFGALVFHREDPSLKFEAITTENYNAVSWIDSEIVALSVTYDAKMLRMESRDPIRDAIASEIRAWRGRRGMTQAELIAKSGLSRSTIGRIENAETDVSIPQIVAIADALGASWIKILTDAQDSLDVRE